MPIYAYRCAGCGHAKDVLQRISDPVLTVCPACGQDTFRKQVTAAGFQLKGSGWYVTDFRGDKPATKSSDSDDAGRGTEKSAESSADKAATGAADGAKSSPAESPGAAAPVPSAAAPAAAAKPSPVAPPASGTGTKPG